MNAGLPGTGIGGLFYMLSALWMPVAALIRMARGSERPSNWKLVVSQFGLAAGIFAAFGVIIALIDYFIPAIENALSAAVPFLTMNSQPVSLGVAPTLITLGVLFGYLFSIEILGMFLAWRKRVRGRSSGSHLNLKTRQPLEDTLG